MPHDPRPTPGAASADLLRADLADRLVFAVQSGDLEAVAAALSLGADPNAFDSASGEPVLMLAAARGEAPLVQAFLERGADPNAMDRRAGTSVLHKACQRGSLEIVRMLVEAGAFVDHQATSTGHTPLVEAIWYKAPAVVDCLLGAGARLSPPTYYGFSLDDHLAYALRVNTGPGARETLLRIRQSVEDRRRSDALRIEQNTLAKAVLAKDAGAVAAALHAGADLEARYPMVGGFSDGHTPLLIAARDGLTDIVARLIQAGADVNAVEPVFGAVPLHKATYNGYLEITRLLADAPGINLDYQGASNGYTPLHDALWHGFADCARVLVEAGARTDLVAYDGKRPVDIASEVFGASDPIVRLLAPGSAGPA